MPERRRGRGGGQTAVPGRHHSDAGVVVGFGGIAGHTFIGLHKAENSYFHRAMSTQDYSAVTAACMMSKKSLFEEVGGFTEELAVAFNDIDYCMKVRAAGKLVVYNPYALLYHYESKSRGLETRRRRLPGSTGRSGFSQSGGRRFWKREIPITTRT